MTPERLADIRKRNAEKAFGHFESAPSHVVELLAYVDELKGSAAVCVNAFKAMEMMIKGAISVQEFESIVDKSQADIARGAEWLNEYVGVSHQRIAELEKEVGRLTHGQRD